MSKINWTKQSKTVSEDGTRIVYDGEGTDLVIISDKRRIPHAGRDGYWYHTTFILHDVITDWGKEFWTLKDAKECAEQMIEEVEDAEV